MIYQIFIRQYFDGGMHHEYTECYDSAETLKKAFDSLNSEVEFGRLVYSNISQCLENDCFSEFKRRNGNCETWVGTRRFNPISASQFRISGAFATEKGMGLLKRF